VRTVAYAVWLLAWLYLLVLVARMVIGLVMTFSPSWRPRGAAAAVAEVVYTVTDPPLRLVRRVIKPVRMGQVSLDLGFMVVAFAVSMVAYGAARLAGGGPP
jgi:YggT family protein